ncbi:glycerol-3-phosphate acyltransferase [Caldanaerobius polysaccharolyticus]|uniref:glycerol-3-phosphate acyltransferase n=1 Tax=Caldanaerobius polysaccharolyticus TaxID=44256 RepID=UPI00047BEF23|nr:glycerol-3-phosphate acyltransferase [Caldanaerobius polysaccharolyticus]
MIIIPGLIELACGSLMFSYWLGLIVGKRLEKVRDGNPGAFNLWCAAGFKVGIIGAALDFMKGYFPLVYFIEKGHFSGNNIAVIAIMPILGHAFSPFLRFKGGKALAATFGIWSATTRFEGSFMYAVILGILKLAERMYNKGKPSLPEVDAVLDILGFVILGIILIMGNFESYLLLLWLFNFVVLLYKRKNDIAFFLRVKLAK